MMEYKSYAAGPIDFDPEDKTFSGTVAGLRDVIHFEGRTATELAREMCIRDRDWPVQANPFGVPGSPSTDSEETGRGSRGGIFSVALAVRGI